MGPATTEAGGLPFIISLDSTKPNDESRKLIRSHVMKGKNKGKCFTERGLDKAFSRSKKKSHVPAPEISAPIPDRVGTDISLGFEPADTIEVSLLLPVFKFAAIAKRAMFSLEPHILFDHATQTRYREYLGVDAAYLNSVVYAVHLYFDLAAGLKVGNIQPSRPAYKHLCKSLSLIRERLACEDDQVKLTDSTVMAILALAFYSCISGQHETALNHLRGIRRIVDLRGGMSQLRTNPKLLIEIFRCDISLALGSGEQPVFFDNPVVEPFMPYLNGLSGFIPLSFRACTSASMTSDEVGISNVDLARAWDTTSTFCVLLNYASESNRKIPQETLLNTMASVMYRLLHLKCPSGTLEEIFRLGILGFCSNIFLQWSTVKFPHRHLSTTYKRCLADLAVPIAPQALLWLLSFGFISLSLEEDYHWLQPWLRTTFDTCSIDSWIEARTILKSHLWVDFLHDRPGAQMFGIIYQPPSIP